MRRELGRSADVRDRVGQLVRPVLNDAAGADLGGGTDHVGWDEDHDEVGRRVAEGVKRRLRVSRGLLTLQLTLEKIEGRSVIR